MAGPGVQAAPWRSGAARLWTGTAPAPDMERTSIDGDRHMPDLNMKYLRTFLVFVEEKSTAKTGHRLGIHQNNVLGHISKVERVDYG